MLRVVIILYSYHSFEISLPDVLVTYRDERVDYCFCHTCSHVACRNCFNVVTPEKSYILQASSNRVKVRWMSLLCMHYVITIATDVYYWYLRLLSGIHPMQLKLSFLSVLEMFSNLSLMLPLMFSFGMYISVDWVDASSVHCSVTDYEV